MLDTNTQNLDGHPKSGQVSIHKFGSRFPELDGIRGIAILTVLLYHVFAYSMMRGVWTGFPHLVQRVMEHGARGVDLFFVLSGFLITGILLDTRSDPRYFRNFYARRALRILPVYYAVLLAILIFYRHSGNYVLLSFFYLSNIAPILGIAMVNGAMWSLSVEEHYYLLWPLLVRKLQPQTVAVVAAAVCVAEPVIRGLAFSHVASVFPYTWFRLDGIACGALLACFVRSSRYSLQNAKTLVIALASIGVVAEVAGTPWGIRQHETLFGAIAQFTTINLLCAAAVLWGVSRSELPQTRMLRNSFLTILGELSYCLYLVHCLVMNAYDASLKALHYRPITDFKSILLRAVVVVGLSFAIAAISRNALELPALRLKRFFEPSDATAVEATHIAKESVA
jgi:peptidoglycan/LPS O-acetylase OafA/YrhL